MFKSLLPWKHTKTKVMVPEQTMEDEQILPVQKLVPCNTCGRTFLPSPLKKHAPICEKSSVKKRRVFDSLKQRVEGTDLAQFHQKSYIKRQDSIPKTVDKVNKQSKWEENHQKLVDAIRSAKGASRDMSSTNKKPQPAALSSNERCPFCDRQFGPKAFDRHVEWCKEHRTRIQKSPASILLAKERLEARTKYKVPPLNKSKRATVKEKYSNNAIIRTESVCSVKSTPCKVQSRTLIKKPKSVLDLGKKADKIQKTNSVVAVDEAKKCKEATKSLRTKRYCAREKTNSTHVNETTGSMTVSPLKLVGFPSKKLVTWREISEKVPENHVKVDVEAVIVVYENSSVFGKKDSTSRCQSNNPKFIEHLMEILTDSDEDLLKKSESEIKSSVRSSSSNSNFYISPKGKNCNTEKTCSDEDLQIKSGLSDSDLDGDCKTDSDSVDDIEKKSFSDGDLQFKNILLFSNIDDESNHGKTCCLEDLTVNDSDQFSPKSEDVKQDQDNVSVDFDLTENPKLSMSSRSSKYDDRDAAAQSIGDIFDDSDSFSKNIEPRNSLSSVYSKFVSSDSPRSPDSDSGGSKFQEIGQISPRADDDRSVGCFPNSKEFAVRLNFNSGNSIKNFCFDKENQHNCENLEYEVPKKRRKLNSTFTVDTASVRKDKNEEAGVLKSDNVANTSRNCLLPKIAKEYVKNEKLTKIEKKKSPTRLPLIESTRNERATILEKRSKRKNKNNHLRIKKDISCAFLSYQSATTTPSYDPFASAERQFMELLECDDFKPFQTTTNPLAHTPRPHTAKKKSIKITSKKSVKSAETISNKKRASVIDPPVCFQDPDPTDDDFEMLENLLNDHFNEESDGFYLGLNKQNKDDLNVILNERKYSDDVCSIDSSLINENDNLSIPEHFKLDNYSPTSTEDTDTTIRNDDIDLYSLQYDKTIEPQTNTKTTEKKRKNFKTKAKSDSSCGLGRDSTKTNKNKTKNAPSEPVKPKSKPDDGLLRPQTRKNSNKVSESEEEPIDLNVKPEDLFAVDDKMYAEYKIYEEMYLKEKEQKSNSKKQKGKNAVGSYGIEIASEDNVIGKISDDSAYGSLNRNTPNPKTAKLTPLERKRVDSASSSGSEHFPNSPLTSQQRMSKFCHECGNKYPLTTAKFCVECGVRRLVL